MPTLTFRLFLVRTYQKYFLIVVVSFRAMPNALRTSAALRCGIALSALIALISGLMPLLGIVH
jgi:hypothetical protein